MTNKQEVVTRRIAGETVIVPVKGGVGDLNSIYTLNQTGTLIWELLGAEVPVTDIVSALCREYDVGKDAAESDIEEFLNALQAEGLIRAAQECGG